MILTEDPPLRTRHSEIHPPVFATGSLTERRPLLSIHTRPLQGGRTQPSCRGELYRELWAVRKPRLTPVLTELFHVGKRYVSAP